MFSTPVPAWSPTVPACANRLGWAINTDTLAMWVKGRRAIPLQPLPGLAYLLGLLAKIKCSICSYQCEN